MSTPAVKLKDGRSECWSIMVTVNSRSYLDLVEASYDKDGGLDGQRPAIKSKSGLKIRNRLVRDISQGAVIPPVVIGVVCSPEDYDFLSVLDDSDTLISTIKDKSLDVSIIDGMQRTTALKEAKVDDALVRVEIWLSHKVDSLIYRMLVLNTGQVPWDLKRQLDVLYKPLLKKVGEQIADIRVIANGDTSRRSQAGTYKSSRVVELFLAFTSRSIDVDIKDKMADEFAKIDITDAASNEEYFPLFLSALTLLVDMDAQFDRVSRGVIEASEEYRIKVGRDIFTSAPASIGFIVAVAEAVLGIAGFDYDVSEARERMEKVKGNADTLIKFMSSLEPQDLANFIDFETLNEVHAGRGKTSRIGEVERNFYLRAFSFLFKHVDRIIENGSMYPCWRTA
ncbi:hypothetical protein [Pseudomonas sp. nanlin1]|uniref:hypothetical protein n=1 Tax=Pseudomonas sp. nanlin1 TaxID=3040605 RepID=UPI00388E3F69